MIKSWIIAKRELKDRLTTRSFFTLSIVGPLMVIGLIYLLFTLGGKEQKHWNVLIVDPANIFENRMLLKEDKAITYSFGDGYIELKDFEKGKQFQQFDAFLEINEKILSNKTAFVFYREKPSLKMQSRIQYQTERRLEEVLVTEFTKFTPAEFKKIKQPLSMGFRNIYDPLNTSNDISAWVGLFYGTVIILFIFLFGMTILRSIGKEKSNRIVEVLLGSISPKQLMFGKILGIGIAAFIQFAIWILIIGFGLFLIKENVYHDLFDFANINNPNNHAADKFFLSKDYNQFVELIYERINFTVMTGYFILFFVLGYLFYGSFFASIGAASGSESDGQQFVIPLLFVLGFAIYCGYYALEYPNNSFTSFCQYFPFTSPIVVMVKLSQGYETSEYYKLILSFISLLVSTFVVINFAARIYTNGILQFGHRVKLSLLFKWLKNKRL